MRVPTMLMLSVAICVAPAGNGLFADPTTTAAETKFATDPALREGMIAIRNLLRLNQSLVTHRRMPPDHAQRFAKSIRAEADKILASSTVSGAAKVRLAALLDEIVAGVEAVAHPQRGVTPIDGIVRADEALAQYPRAFDHSGWAPLQSAE